MSVLVNKNSKIIVQGFTGTEGTFHAEQMIAYGTQVVGGVTPGKGGAMHLDRPIFNTVADAVTQTGADTSIIFVPPAFAADAIMEAADAGIKVIICITEGIPTKDMIVAKEYINHKDCRLIGPNCPGVMTAGEVSEKSVTFLSGLGLPAFFWSSLRTRSEISSMTTGPTSRAASI